MTHATQLQNTLKAAQTPPATNRNLQDYDNLITEGVTNRRNRLEAFKTSVSRKVSQVTGGFKGGQGDRGLGRGRGKEKDERFGRNRGDGRGRGGSSKGAPFECEGKIVHPNDTYFGANMLLFLRHKRAHYKESPL